MAALLFFWGAAPSFAGKEALSDQELDRATATGESDISQIKGKTIEIGISDTPVANVNIMGNSQSQVHALTVNNAAGSNLIANGMNVSGRVNVPTAPR